MRWYNSPYAPEPGEKLIGAKPAGPKEKPTVSAPPPPPPSGPNPYDLSSVSEHRRAEARRRAAMGFLPGMSDSDIELIVTKVLERMLCPGPLSLIAREVLRVTTLPCMVCRHLNEDGFSGCEPVRSGKRDATVCHSYERAEDDNAE